MAQTAGNVGASVGAPARREGADWSMRAEEYCILQAVGAPVGASPSSRVPCAAAGQVTREKGRDWKQGGGEARVEKKAGACARSAGRAGTRGPLRPAVPALSAESQPFRPLPLLCACPYPAAVAAGASASDGKSAATGCFSSWDRGPALSEAATQGSRAGQAHSLRCSIVR